MVPAYDITRAILLLRGHRVILDAELATLYGVSTKALNQASSATPSGFRKISCSGSPGLRPRP